MSEVAVEGMGILNQAERRHIETLQRILDETAEPGAEGAALAWAIKTLHEAETAVRVTRLETQMRRMNGRIGELSTRLDELYDQDAEDDEEGGRS